MLIGEPPLGRGRAARRRRSRACACAPATIDLAGAEIELVSMVAREYRLRRACAAYLPAHEAGTAGRLRLHRLPAVAGPAHLNALVARREVLIPIQCEYYALEGLASCCAPSSWCEPHLNPELHVSTILLTMYDGRTRLAAQVADEVRTHFGDKVLQTVIPRSVRVSEAPVRPDDADLRPGLAGALTYLEAARELAGARAWHRPPAGGRVRPQERYETQRA